MDKSLKGKKVSAISLGCDKNRVDLERMLFALKNYGLDVVDDVNDADIVVVNTCAFITPAKEEAITSIFDMCALKEKGRLEKVIVSGCLPQRHKSELVKEVPEVDAFLSADDNAKICEIVEKLYNATPKKTKKGVGRLFTCHGPYAYLKIAEGCSNACSYCTIPRIKGRYVSFMMDDILDEAKYLAENDIKEIILVAQDVSRYGEDLYGKNCLMELCKKLVKIDGIEWIRLHYCYPEKIDEKFLDFMVQEPKMCNYLDVPFQHVDDRILKSMRRHINEEETHKFVEMLKRQPEIALRTTFIVGYPSETKKDFKKLCKFIEESKFDYAGFFPYFREENTPSYFMDGQLSQRVKNSRFKKIKKLQNKIAGELACQKLGQTFRVLLDYFDESKGVFVGHPEFCSPTVDFGVEIVDNGNIQERQFVDVKFLSFDGENFKGECYESSK